MQALIFLAAICLGVAIFGLIRHFEVRSAGVKLHEEWKEAKIDEHNKSRKVYILVGGLICALAAYIITGQALFAVFALPGGIVVAKKSTLKHDQQRLELLEQQYKQILGTMCSGLQGGLSPMQALEEIVPSMPSPSREIFVEILRRERTGWKLEKAVEEVCKETGWTELISFKVALSIYENTGSNLVEIFRHLEESAYEREAEKKYIRSVTAQMRMTSSMLSVLPFVVLTAARFFAPDFVDPLFTTAGGIVVVIVAFSLVFAGKKVMDGMMAKVMGI